MLLPIFHLLQLNTEFSCLNWDMLPCIDVYLGTLYLYLFVFLNVQIWPWLYYVTLLILSVWFRFFDTHSILLGGGSLSFLSTVLSILFIMNITPTTIPTTISSSLFQTLLLLVSWQYNIFLVEYLWKYL